MKTKILALGREEVTGWVNQSLVAEDFGVVRLFELPDSLTLLKQERFDIVLVDSGLPDIENVCFRVAWLCRLKIAVVSPDPQSDMQLLSLLGVNAFISNTSPASELADDIAVLTGRGAPEFENIRVLAVEDDRHIREAIQLHFRVLWPEAEICFASEGQSAINLFKNKPIDLVLLDLGLPDISGLEVLKWIRTCSRVPVIILTAVRDREHVVSAIEAGANDYLVKPFKQIELMPRIRKYSYQYAQNK